jgi:hypothetical protein
LENYMTTYLLGSGSIDLKLATFTVGDYVAGNDVEIVAVAAQPSWLDTLAADLDLPTTTTVPAYTAVDTVLVPGDAPEVEDILRTGAAVKDLSDGLVDLEWVPDAADDVAYVPDIPEELPAESTYKKPTLDALPPKASEKKAPEPKPVAKKAPAKKPAAKKAPVALKEPVKEAPQPPTPERPIVSTDEERTALETLVKISTERASKETLYNVLDVLRGTLDR